MGFRIWDCGLQALKFLWTIDSEEPGWAKGMRILELVCAIDMIAAASATLLLSMFKDFVFVVRDQEQVRDLG